MRPVDTSPLLARQRDHDIRRAACSARLVALATCCEPGLWSSALRRAASAVRRS